MLDRSWHVLVEGAFTCTLIACSGDLEVGTPLPAAPSGPTDAALVVAATALTVRRDQGVYRVDIPFRYVNRTAAVLANPGCHPPMAPQLEWWTGETWKEAYQNISLACLSPPFLIEAGGTFSDTLRMLVFRDSVSSSVHGQMPYWLGPRVAADYRILWTVCDYRDLGGSDANCEPARLERSAPFRMEFSDE